MNAETVKQCLDKLSESVTFKYPATGWYFFGEQIEDSFVFRKDKWVCMFMYWKMVLKKGKRIRFSGDSAAACTGPPEYFGFKELTDDRGEFIAEVERFKKSKALAQEYYKESLKSIHTSPEKYLYMEQIGNIDKNIEIAVVNLFPDITGIALLTFLSSYDRGNNLDNVIAPFASGCQSVFTVPYDEGFKEKPKSIIGLMDPLVRNFVPQDMICFSLPANRFVEMVNNMEGSFLDNNFENPSSF